jgi:SAM-dependent methyltransferase
MSANGANVANAREKKFSQLYAGADFPEWSTKPYHLYSHEQQLVDHYCSRKDMSILTVGCGAGRETFCIYERGFRQIRGVDLTPEFVALANQRSRDLHLDIPFVVGSVRELPFPDAAFDVVTFFANIYGHITPKVARLEALAEAKRVLKPGGLILMESQCVRNIYWHFLIIRAMEISRRLWNPYDLGRGDKLTHYAKQVKAPPHELPRSHWFRPYEIDGEATEAGFEVALASTVKDVAANPAVNSRRYRGKGRLVYVLRKPGT